MITETGHFALILALFVAIVQSVVPLRAFLKIYSGMLIGAAGLACLIGALVFQALRPVVLRWQSLEERRLWTAAK